MQGSASQRSPAISRPGPSALNYCTTVPVHLNALQADRVAQLTSRNVPFEVEVSGLASKPRVVRG